MLEDTAGMLLGSATLSAPPASVIARRLACVLFDADVQFGGDVSCTARPGIDADTEWDSMGVFSGNCVLRDNGIQFTYTSIETAPYNCTAIQLHHIITQHKTPLFASYVP